jgi:hypothetical protein
MLCRFGGEFLLVGGEGSMDRSKEGRHAGGATCWHSQWLTTRKADSMAGLEGGKKHR